MQIHLVHENVRICYHWKLQIIPDARIRNIVSKGPKYEIPSHIDFSRCREEIASAISDLCNRGVKGRVLSVML